MTTVNEQTEPTIPERLRRLHQLYLADAAAEAYDSDDTDPSTAWLRRTLEHRIETEVHALQEAAAGLRATDPHRRIAVALLDLRAAASRQVLLRPAQDAYRSAELSGTILPKSQLVEQRRFFRGQAKAAEGDAQRAMSTIVSLFDLRGGR